MGALTSRQHAGVEEVDIPSNSVYRYPPKSGEGARRTGWGGGRAAPGPGLLGTERHTSLQSELGGREVREEACRDVSGALAGSPPWPAGRERPSRRLSCDRRVLGGLRLPRGGVPREQAGPGPPQPRARPLSSHLGPSFPWGAEGWMSGLGIRNRHLC